MIGQEEIEGKSAYRVVGLDLSRTCTGLCLIGPKTRRALALRPRGSAGLEKLLSLREQVFALVDEFRPILAVIEGYSFASTHKSFEIGEYAGIIKLGLYERQVETLIVSPKEVKRFITGDGSADKKTVQQALRVRYHWDIRSHDAADAAALALLGRAILDGHSPFRSELELIRKLDQPKKTCTKIAKPEVNL